MIGADVLKHHAMQYRLVVALRAGREFLRLVRSLVVTSAFDPELYATQRGRRFPGRTAAALDYVVAGSRLGLVAGPLLLVPEISTTGRPRGLRSAVWWAAGARRVGFPRDTAHPLTDIAWYEKRTPGAAEWPGAGLAHYTDVGRGAGLRLGPSHPAGVDLVSTGTAAVLAATSQIPTPTPGAAVTATAIVMNQPDAGRLRSLLRSLVDAGDTVAETLILVTDPPTPDFRLLLEALRWLEPAVRALLVSGAPIDVLNTALNVAAGTNILVFAKPMQLSANSVRALAGAVGEGPREANLAQPIVLAPDGTIDSAGIAILDGHQAPQLLGYPVADAVRNGDVRVSAVTENVFAVSRFALQRTIEALDPGVSDIAAIAKDLSDRIRSDGGDVRLVSGATVWLAPGTGPSAVQSAPSPTISRPLLDSTSNGFRWAIKSAHPAGLRGATWGDYHFAHALATALEALGQQVAVDPLDSWYRRTSALDDVTLTLRGLHRYEPAADKLNLLWVISHPELLHPAELTDFDASFAASISWAADRSKFGALVEPLLQCTDGSLFFRDGLADEVGFPVLFVGNSRGARRPLLDAALAAGLEVAVFGTGWDGLIPTATLRGEFVPNAELPQMYRSAGVVLNDHWPDMAREGFLSNRLFDLTASGARWVSDPARDITTVFPTARVAGNSAELAALIAGSPESFPNAADRSVAATEVLRTHTFNARAATLLATVHRLLGH
jgi:hypothetical protein